MSTHHMLDIKPVPEQVLYINEPWLVDASFDCLEKWLPEPDDQPDNVRIYALIDLNAEAILRRLRTIIGDMEKRMKPMSRIMKLRLVVWSARSRSMIRCGLYGRDPSIPIKTEESEYTVSKLWSW